MSPVTSAKAQKSEGIQQHQLKHITYSTKFT